MMKIFYKYLIKRSFYFSFLILAAFGFLDSIFMLLSELENISEKSIEWLRSSNPKHYEFNHSGVRDGVVAKTLDHGLEG